MHESVINVLPSQSLLSEFIRTGTGTCWRDNTRVTPGRASVVSGGALSTVIVVRVARLRIAVGKGWVRFGIVMGLVDELVFGLGAKNGE